MPVGEMTVDKKSVVEIVVDEFAICPTEIKANPINNLRA